MEITLCKTFISTNIQDVYRGEGIKTLILPTCFQVFILIRVCSACRKHAEATSSLTYSTLPALQLLMPLTWSIIWFQRDLSFDALYQLLIPSPWRFASTPSISLLGILFLFALLDYAGITLRELCFHPCVLCGPKHEQLFITLLNNFECWYLIRLQ